MLLRDLTLPVKGDEAKAMALVFYPSLAVRLQDLHAAYGSPNCVPVPLVLGDGRMMLGADVLTEVEPGGLLADMWAHADQAVVGAEVKVMPWADAVALLPPPPTMPWEVS